MLYLKSSFILFPSYLFNPTGKDFIFKDPCNETGPTQIFQTNLSISWSIPLIIYAEFLVPSKVTHSCEYMKTELFLYYYLLIIVSFSVQTTINLLLPDHVFTGARIKG